ncbi:MAG TPA: GDSL-type esterase/lipase family protein [Frankiaceae bacterium]|nr:GDSL-type esterase/lipase family protein [Frankiaceae bacterium]
MADEGLVCVGDSIITAEQSWGFRVAQAGGWPLVRVSARGARSWQVLEQLPHLRGHRYAVGALTAGANDVLFDWDAACYEANLRNILKAMSPSCERLLIATLPRSFRRFPGSSPARREHTASANRIILAAAAEVGAEIVDGGDLGGRLMRPDRVHPSVLGHLVLADRAARLLGLGVQPSAIATGARNEDSGVRYLAVTARHTLRELRARVTRPGQPT